jgi:hypothetical protein
MIRSATLEFSCFVSVPLEKRRLGTERNCPGPKRQDYSSSPHTEQCFALEETTEKHFWHCTRFAGEGIVLTALLRSGITAARRRRIQQMSTIMIKTSMLIIAMMRRRSGSMGKGCITITATSLNLGVWFNSTGSEN